MNELPHWATVETEEADYRQRHEDRWAEQVAYRRGPALVRVRCSRPGCSSEWGRDPRPALVDPPVCFLCRLSEQFSKS